MQDVFDVNAEEDDQREFAIHVVLPRYLLPKLKYHRKIEE